LALLEERIDATRHYEFFWHPRRDLFEHKALHPTDAAPSALPDRKRERIDASYRIFPSVRERRFNEMEYAVPAAAGRACFDEVRRFIRSRAPELDWPVEYRTLAADDVWLSPAHDRASVTISVHQGAEDSYDTLFAECEAVFRAHDGRPHWGKVHSMEQSALAAMYPRWHDFRAARHAADPDGVFVNDYLRRLLDVDASVSRRTNGGLTTRASST
jgi:FAD/FMN-containing dehydrogenase